MKRAIVFGVDSRLGRQGSVEVDLKNRRGESLGIEVLFTRDFLKRNGETFLRLLRSSEESRVEAGIRLRW